MSDHPESTVTADDSKPFASVEQRLIELEGLLNTPQVVDQSLAREAEDRSWVARRIIWIFVGVIAAGLGIIVLGAMMTGKWDEATRQAVDLIKSCVFPVVTLVLGYYFGRSGKG